MHKTMANILVCKRGQGALGTYRDWSPELTGGSVGCGHERGRRPGSRAGKRRVSDDARAHADHNRLNQGHRGDRDSPKLLPEIVGTAAASGEFRAAWWHGEGIG